MDYKCMYHQIYKEGHIEPKFPQKSNLKIIRITSDVVEYTNTYRLLQYNLVIRRDSLDFMNSTTAIEILILSMQSLSVIQDPQYDML